MKRTLPLLILLPASALAQRPTTLGASSMTNEVAERGLFERRTAHHKGDVLRITVNETMQGQYSASTTTNKSIAASTDKISLPLVDVFAGPVLGKILGAANASFGKNIIDGGLGANTVGAKEASSGDGTAKTAGSFTGTLSVIVTDVDANGNLTVRGTRDVRVNKEVQKMVLTGVVRADDVTPENTVPSDRIANANIEADGKGAVAAKTRRSLLNKILDWLY